MKNLLYLFWATVLACAMSIFLFGCTHTRPAPVNTQALASAVTGATTAATQTKNHVTAAQSDAERIDAKATVILQNWK